MAKSILSDGEHRDYYDDRSLKAVYTLKDGKKEGTYTVYEQNSDAIKLTEEYSNGELHGKRIEYSWGHPRVTETYDHGTITERRWGEDHYETYEDGQLSHVFEKYSYYTDVDMYYKDGKEYEGSYYRKRQDRDGDSFPIKYTVKEGKYHGEYVDTLKGFRINYDMGVLHGKYYAEQEDGSIKEGNYNQGKFTGTITSKDGKTTESWVDNNLECVTNYADADKKRILYEIRPNGTCVEYSRGKIVKKYEQKNGKKHGKYEEFDPKGWLRESSIYENGELKEKTEFYSDGKVVTKNKDKTSDGEHREYYEDRSLKAVYTLKDGKKDGTYTVYEQNSDAIKLTEEYSNGELHGKRIEYSWGHTLVTETYDHGTITERRWGDDHYETYENGQLNHVFEKNNHSDIDMYYKDGKEYEGSYYRRRQDRDGDNFPIKYTVKEGKYDGEYVDMIKDIQINYDMGVLHGKYYAVQEDGSIKEGEYNQGRFTGTITSKDRRTIEHVNGHNRQFTGTVTSKDGKTLENWVNGSLECVTTYKSAKKDWFGNVTSRGDIISEVRPNGTCVEYSHGKVVKRYEQVNGRKEGKYEEFDPKGWLKTEAQYKDGELNGFYKEYNSDGTIATRRFYKDGKDITPKRNILIQAAKENVQSTEGVSPRQSKLKKAALAIKIALAGKNGKDK